jgi:hypothetical protein
MWHLSGPHGFVIPPSQTDLRRSSACQPTAFKRPEGRTRDSSREEILALKVITEIIIVKEYIEKKFDGALPSADTKF